MEVMGDFALHNHRLMNNYWYRRNCLLQKEKKNIKKPTDNAKWLLKGLGKNETLVISPYTNRPRKRNWI